MRAPALHDNNRHLPSVDAVLRCEEAISLIAEWGRETVLFAVRSTIDRFRKKGIPELKNGDTIAPEAILEQAVHLIRSIGLPSLRPVINATGVILHTNLGRAPLGKAVLKALTPIVDGYSNLEFDCSTAKRGHRATHITRVLTCLTHAEDALVVNNNAAAIILALHTLAREREVIVSRGELIEIGGAFRIPDIMAASGARMVEVGTTNRTRAGDYEQAITPETALLFKAHKSNYAITGFTEEVPIHELATLAHAHKMPLFYDIGSGLLRKPKMPGVTHEPDVRSALEQGADLVSFSGDKLLGGPQSGIIVGKKELIQKLSHAPLMRALRVGKLTLAALSSACRSYLNDNDLLANNPIFSLLERPLELRHQLAETLCKGFERCGVDAEIVPSTVQCGGGTLPDLKLSGFAVALIAPGGSAKERGGFAEQIYMDLLQDEIPILGVLREGRLLFDTGALRENDIESIVAAVANCVGKSAR